MKPTYILGLNSFHADSSAVLLKDGELIGAVAEERLNRVKHFAGFPALAIREVLDLAGIGIADVDHIGINKDSKANLMAKLGFAMTNLGRITKMARQRLEYRAKVRNTPNLLCEALGIRPTQLRAQIHNIEHHLCHAASCFLVSDFDRAAIFSVDGFGDFASTLTAVGQGTQIDVLDRTLFPHSLGILYTMVCQFIGYDKYGDEGKVMGLAPYGEPSYDDFFDRLVRLKPNGRFELNLDYFLHHREGVDYSFDDQGYPSVAPLFSEAMVQEFGRPRQHGDELTQRDKDLAASLQKCLEKAYFHILNHLYEQTHCEALCLAGGVALNSVATEPPSAWRIMSTIAFSASRGPASWTTPIPAASMAMRTSSQSWTRPTELSPSVSPSRNSTSARPRPSPPAKSSVGSRGRWNGDHGLWEIAPSLPTRGCRT